VDERAARIVCMADPDGNLLRSFREGDEEAFRTLVNRHVSLVQGRLGRQIPAHLRRRIAMSDIIQETCIVAFRRRGDFEDRGTDAFAKWICGIAEHKLKEEIRRHAGSAKRSVHREATRGDRPDTAYLIGSHPTPSVIAIAAERLDRIRDAMAQLPPDYRTVLELATEQGLPLREAAEKLGRTPDATKKLHSRALCRLRQLLDGETSRGA
jgi:RNA polymerase sigma-70 factor (ECF subfamily)